MIFGYSPLDFQQFKIVALEFTGLAKDALHIYAGLAVFLLVRLLWRWRGGWVLAWIVVAAMACGVEWIDVQAEGVASTNPTPDGEHWHDIWNTLFWPTVLLCVGRWLQPKQKAKVVIVDPEVESSNLADQTLDDSGKQSPPI